jgi:uncharacterized protein YjbI with pentapeptide repeats
MAKRTSRRSTALVATKAPLVPVKEPTRQALELAAHLQAGPQALGQFLEGKPRQTLDLAWVSLTSLIFPRIDLSGALLVGTVFTDSDLNGSILTGADLRWLVGTGGKFRAAIFSGSDMRGAVLTGSDLTDAKFVGADLTSAIFNGADVSGANFTGAICKGAYFIGVRGLDKAVFEGAVLAGAYFSPGVYPEHLTQPHGRVVITPVEKTPRKQKS